MKTKCAKWNVEAPFNIQRSGCLAGRHFLLFSSTTTSPHPSCCGMVYASCPYSPLANILIATRPVLKYDWLSRIPKKHYSALTRTHIKT